MIISSERSARSRDFSLEYVGNFVGIESHMRTADMGIELVKSIDVLFKQFKQRCNESRFVMMNLHICVIFHSIMQNAVDLTLAHINYICSICIQLYLAINNSLLYICFHLGIYNEFVRHSRRAVIIYTNCGLPC